MMQAAPDVMLGWERIITIDGEERDFYIRQLWDSKGSAEVEVMDPAGARGLRQSLRLDARESSRALGRQDRDRRLSRQRRRLRPRHGVVRRDVRGPERAGLPRAAGGGGIRPRRGRDGRLTPPQPRLGSRTVETCCAASSITSRSGCSCIAVVAAIVGLVLVLVWLIRRLVPAGARGVRRRGLLADARRRRRAVRAAARVHRRDRLPELRRHAEQRERRGGCARRDRARQRRVPAARP